MRGWVIWGKGRDEWIPLICKMKDGQHKVVAVETVMVAPGMRKIY